jgi:hypothetical protein
LFINDLKGVSARWSKVEAWILLKADEKPA